MSKKKKIKEIINFSHEIDEILKRGYSGFRNTRTGAKYITSSFIITRVSRRWEFWVEDVDKCIWEVIPRHYSPVNLKEWYYRIYDHNLNNTDIISLPGDTPKKLIREELINLVNRNLVGPDDDTVRITDPPELPKPPEPEDISEADVSIKKDDVENRFELLDL